jgi:hypothetical protein
MIEAGQAAARTTDTALSARHRRIMRHRGYQRAVVAVGHEILALLTLSSLEAPRTTSSVPATSTNAKPSAPSAVAFALSNGSATRSLSSSWPRLLEQGTIF